MSERELCDNCGMAVLDSVIESAHYTSDGVVRYRRCPCGHRWVELVPFAATAY